MLMLMLRVLLLTGSELRARENEPRKSAFCFAEGVPPTALFMESGRGYKEGWLRGR
jgi:hypothetical protein